MPLSTIVVREASPAVPARTSPTRRPIIILAVAATPIEGDQIRATLAASPLTNLVHSVTGLQEMEQYLLRRGRYSVLARSRLPGLILLDEAVLIGDGELHLGFLQAHPALSAIAVVFLRSNGGDGALRPEEPGARASIRKPLTFHRLMESLGGLTSWRLEREDITP